MLPLAERAARRLVSWSRFGHCLLTGSPRREEGENERREAHVYDHDDDRPHDHERAPGRDEREAQDRPFVKDRFQVICDEGHRDGMLISVTCRP